MIASRKLVRPTDFDSSAYSETRPRIEPWSVLEKDFILRPEVLHIWRFNQDYLTDPARAAEWLLAEGETIRVEKINNRKRKGLYLWGRICLKLLLALYRHIEPQELTLYEDPSGRPLAQDRNGEQYGSFSLSHSGEWLIIAIRQDGIVGVDIEARRYLTEVPHIAARFFTAGESALILQGDNATERFFKLWVRKEACSKALGIPLPSGLRMIRIADSEECFPLRLSDRQSVRHTLMCCGFETARGYESAFAASLPLRTVRLLEGKPLLDAVKATRYLS